jgi:hypothetical protein
MLLLLVLAVTIKVVILKHTIMHTTHQIATHLKQLFFGGNWTSVSLKETTIGLSWQQASTNIYTLNSIAALVYHIHYYTAAILQVLQGGPLDAHDKYSYNHPTIQCQQDWDTLLEQTFADAEQLALLIEQLPDEKLAEIFCDVKYGNYYRNLTGLVEHSHYHLGQIALIKKIILQQPT